MTCSRTGQGPGEHRDVFNGTTQRLLPEYVPQQAVTAQRHPTRRIHARCLTKLLYLRISSKCEWLTLCSLFCMFLANVHSFPIAVLIWLSKSQGAQCHFSATSHSSFPFVLFIMALFGLKYMIIHFVSSRRIHMPNKQSLNSF